MGASAARGPKEAPSEPSKTGHAMGLPVQDQRISRDIKICALMK